MGGHLLRRDSTIQGKDAGTKTLAADFKTGELNVPIAKIAASASGRVASASEGTGLPRVAVQVFRLVPDEAPVLTSAGASSS